MKILPNDSSFATFYEMLTGYRTSTLLLTAVNSGLLERLGGDGKSLEGIVTLMKWQPELTRRLLACLVELGVLQVVDKKYVPSLFTRKFLLANSENSQLKTLEFETELWQNWQALPEMLQTGSRSVDDKTADQYKETLTLFLDAMDEAAKVRASELWQTFQSRSEGLIVEIGAGSGAYLQAFLTHNPGWQGVFCDLPDVVAIAQQRVELKQFGERIRFVEGNVLDKDFSLSQHIDGKSDILLLSNFLHCQSEQENHAVLKRTLPVLKESGFVIVHDFFNDLNVQGAMYDLHMMLNTYNGRTYSIAETAGLLKAGDLIQTRVVELPSYSAALFAARSAAHLPDTDKQYDIIAKSLTFGFDQALPVSAADVPVYAWVQEKCRTGCPNYGKKPSCPPHSVTSERMKEILKDYESGILLVGKPPLKQYQEWLLELEKYAFLAGYTKALAFGSGPCSLCDDCTPDNCKFPARCRASLEACGVDVFELAERYGVNLKPLTDRDDVVLFISMLLLE